MNAPEKLAPAEVIETEPKAITYNQPKGSALAKSAERVLAIARSIVVDSNEMAKIAAAELVTIKGRARELDEERKRITKPMDDAKRAVMDIYNPAIEKLNQAEAALKSTLTTYQNEQRRLADLAAAEEARKAREEAEKLRARAEKMEDRGKAEDAEALRNIAAMTAAAPRAVSAPPKLAGVSTRKVWKANVTDRAAAIKALADNPTYQHLLTIDESALNKLAAAMKNPNSPIPGVVFYEDSAMSARAA